MQVTQPVSSYTAEFVELDPDASQFTADLDGPQGNEANLEVDPRSETEVRAVLDGAHRRRATHRWTSRGRSRPTCAAPQFTYSLELADAGRRQGSLSGGAAGPVPRDQARLLRAVQPRRWSCSRGRPASRPGWRPASCPGVAATATTGWCASQRRPRVARAVLPAARLGAVRAHTGHPQRRRAGVQPGADRQRVLGSSAGPEHQRVVLVRHPVDRAASVTSPTDDLGTTTGTSEHGAWSASSSDNATTILVAAPRAASSPRSSRSARGWPDAGLAVGRRRRRRARRGGVAVPAAAAAGHRLRAARRGDAAPGVPPDRARRHTSSPDESHGPRPGGDDPRSAPATPVPVADLADVAGRRADGVARARSRAGAAADRVRALLLPEEGRRHWRDGVRRLVPWQVGRERPTGEDD